MLGLTLYLSSSVTASCIVVETVKEEGAPDPSSCKVEVGEGVYQIAKFWGKGVRSLTMQNNQ